MNPLALGIDLGGTRIKHVVVSDRGETLESDTHAFDPNRHMDWKQRIQTIRQNTLKRFDPASLQIGLSAPGLASKDRRSIAHMPGRLSGLEGLVWQDALQHPHPVPIINDAQAALMGEVWQGSAKGLEHVIMITLGTGVGGAAMVDGHLLSGHLGRAGHLGHISLDVDGPLDICRTPGSLEWAIGNCTIQERTQGRYETTHALVEAHLHGDSFASSVWLQSVKYLATGLVSLINVLDPEAILIGGGIATAAEALFEPLRQHLDEMEWMVGDHRVRLIQASLGEFAGAYGAAQLARQHAMS